MGREREDIDPPRGSEERLRRMRSSRPNFILPLAWLPVVLIAGAVGVLFWWLTQTIQPDRDRILGTPPALVVGTAVPRGAPGPTLPPTAGLTVGEILKNRQRYLNEPISVTGRYRARDAKGELKGQPAVSTNDWVLSDGTNAIWVTGRGPADLSLTGDRDLDTPLLVEGTLRELAGKTVLDARAVIVAGRAPVVASSSTATPQSGGSGAASGIQPGGYVKVVGTGGAQLNFRSGPSATFGRVTEQPLLPDGTRLRVLEGPKQGDDNRIWWRLQSEKGVIGWAVQDFLEATPGP